MRTSLAAALLSTEKPITTNIDIYISPVKVKYKI